MKGISSNSSLQSAKQFGIGVVGLTFITFVSGLLHLQPGAVSLLYLIIVVFTSLRAGFVSSLLVSLVAVFQLHYHFAPVVSPSGEKNPLAFVASVAFLITAWVITAMVAQVRKLTENRLTVAFEERLAERNRIARELHDTLLQSFQGSMLQFQAINNLLPPGNAKDALEKALDRADQAIVEGRDAIQNLRSTAPESYDLADSIAALAEELGAPNTQGNAPVLRVSVEGTPRELEPMIRDEIYRIAREALQNAFNHARAHKLEAEINYGRRLLRVRIRDDGKGIDPKVLSVGREGHWGLAGMRERAQQIGAELEIWSELRAGTEVELRIPASVVYQTTVRSGGFRLFRKQKEAVHER